MNSLRSPTPNAGFFNLAPKRNNAANGLMNTAKNAANSVVTAVNSAVGGVTGNTGAQKGISATVIILLVLLVALVITFAVFWQQIQDFFRNLTGKTKVALGGSEPAPPPSDKEMDVTQKPAPPQNREPSDQQKMVEKILPGMKQVFNISSNKYTYYDAEPLCKALGAELATYEQVKQAYAQGADWCNYGWTKGQMAVFPTQESTWEELQSGPEAQRTACGRPGLNGGYFDNPELQFGVNCYGPKPEQKDHDATDVTSGAGAPLTVAGNDFEKKVAKYRGEASGIGILPFSKKTWSA
jgi:hypothetical protein